MRAALLILALAAGCGPKTVEVCDEELLEAYADWCFETSKMSWRMCAALAEQAVCHEEKVLP